jgi:hypothetical protein
MNYPLIRPSYYLTLFGELKSFVTQPVISENQLKTTREKIIDTIGLFFIKIAFSLLVALLVGLFYDPENQTDQSMTERFSPLLYLLVGGILLPVNEEVLFRLSLRFRPVYLGLTFASLGYYLVTKLVYHTKLSMVDESFWIRIATGLSIGVLILGFASIASLKKRLMNFWEVNFRWLYYFSCISFAWIHIFNFELNWFHLTLLPILTLPQLFSAIIAGYTRTAFGFQYPLLVHMATNILFISISFLPGD